MENLIDKRQITARVRKLTWERIWLHMEVEVTFAQGADTESKLSFYMINGLFEPKAKLQITGIEGNIYKLRINVTNPGTGLCLPQGTEKSPDGKGRNCGITRKGNEQRFQEFFVRRARKSIFRDILCDRRR